MPVTHVFAAISVSNYASARDWYERLFGRPADLIPNDSEAAWQLTESGWVYIVGDAERAGGSLVTVLVDDLDERLAEIAERGLPVGALEPEGDQARSATITDADGNRLKLAQVTGGS